MLNQCKNCGGQIIYDIKSKMLKCPSCESEFEPETYNSMTKAEENNSKGKISMTLYKCPACGAEISSVDNAAVDYCLYCGSFVTLNKSMSKLRKPDYIIPFSRTKEEAREAYKEIVKDDLYAPKEFRNDKFLENFKGIYIPYWTYTYEYGGNIKLEGEHNYESENYDCTQKYDISFKADTGTKYIAFDGSSTFDDNISRQIVPFDFDRRKDFKPEFMFGFYGDTADVPEKTYNSDAIASLSNDIWDEIGYDQSLSAGYPVRPDFDSFEKTVNLKRKSTITMLPVWFLTWKKNKRVAYSVVNGDNGKIFGEIPVSFGRYILFSLLTAIPLFLFLNLFFTFTASTMLGITVALSMLMLLIYSSELEYITKREHHLDDKGYRAVYKNDDDDDYAPDFKENFFVKAFKFIVDLIKDVGIKECIIAAVILFIISLEFIFAIYIAVIITMFIVFPIYTLVLLLINGRYTKDKTIIIDSLGTFAAYVLSLVVFIINPANDMYYYGASIIAIFAMGFSVMRCISRYNKIVTRPVPHFFDRKAGK